MRPNLLQIFLSFAKVGTLTFGGGYSMLPVLQREVVERHGWVKENDITDYYALSQCTPGLIAVNISVYIGYPLRGLAGGLAAALGVITPSVLIILLLAALLQSYAHLPLVASAFAGVRVAVAALIVQSAWRLAKNGAVDKPALIIFVLALVLGLANIINPVLVIVAAAVAGITVQTAKRRGRGDGV